MIKLVFMFGFGGFVFYFWTQRDNSFFYSLEHSQVACFLLQIDSTEEHV